jgi:ABC-2 type transport system permease protein
MPIFDQGYQHWKGKLSGHAWRWMAITRQGVRAQLKNRWTRLAVLVAWLPALALAVVLVAWGLVEQQSSLVAPLLRLFRDLPEELKDGPRNYRVSVWTIAFQYFFYVEMFLSMILVLLIGPNLISQDLRFNAIPLYFSRPLRRVDYFAGKLGVIGVFLAAVAIVPAIIAYFLGICFSLDFSVVRDTGRLLLTAIIYGLVVVLSAGTLMLALSSLSRNTRYVGAMWLGIWFVSGGVAGVLIGTVRAEWCPLVSYTSNLQRIEVALLDTESAWEQMFKVFASGTRVQPPGHMPGMVSPQPAKRSVPPKPPEPSPQMEGRRRGPTPKDLAGTTHPWSWSAGVLAGLFGLSLWTLTSRVKSLDRLK